jgi:DNA polymerase-1
VTGWRPHEFPNLSGSRIIGFDVEGYDPELRKSGPGWGRNKSHLTGISLSAEDGTSWYFPFAHGIEDGKHVLPPEHMAMNMDRDQVLRFVAHTLGDDRPKVGANLIYDVGSLMAEGVEVRGRLYDVQFAEALLNSEAPNVDLDSLAEKYLGYGKVTNVLYEWLHTWCGGNPKDQRANLYLAPPSLVGPYAEGDAAQPVHILNAQWPALWRRGVTNLFDLECRLIPLLVRMRMKGAPVDLDRAHQLHDELGDDLVRQEKALSDIAGQPVNPNARDSLTSAFKRLGIPLPIAVDRKTKERKVSFSAPLLEEIEHPLAAAILDYRRTAKVKNTFVKSYIIEKNVNGRVHCSFHPLKGEGGGARSGRFSSSDPNLQNIPVRTEIGKKVREIFVALGLWRKADYSQIEYRMLAHHAVGPGAHELRETYRRNPDMDYHDKTIALVKDFSGRELDRRPIKNINFGLIYGMSEGKLAGDLGMPLAEGKQLFEIYHKAAPYAKATMDEAAAEVHRLGYVETILGRRSDFTRWGPKRYDPGTSDMEYEAAAREWGVYNIQRSRTHKALNRKLQGGAADVMKKAMVTAYEAGLFEEDACGIPLLTVHDELDFDDLNDPNGPWWAEFKRVMENAVPELSVPVMIDISTGPSWGTAD